MLYHHSLKIRKLVHADHVKMKRGETTSVGVGKGIFLILHSILTSRPNTMANNLKEH